MNLVHAKRQDIHEMGPNGAAVLLHYMGRLVSWCCCQSIKLMHCICQQQTAWPPHAAARG
jgi:hypothetical protein